MCSNYSDNMCSVTEPGDSVTGYDCTFMSQDVGHLLSIIGINHGT